MGVTFWHWNQKAKLKKWACKFLFLKFRRLTRQVWDPPFTNLRHRGVSSPQSSGFEQVTAKIVGVQHTELSVSQFWFFMKIGYMKVLNILGSVNTWRKSHVSFPFLEHLAILRHSKDSLWADGQGFVGAECSPWDQLWSVWAWGRESVSRLLVEAFQNNPVGPSL